MNNTQTTEDSMTLEEKLAQIAAAMQGQQPATAGAGASSQAFACPIDPAERALCEACQ